MENELSLKPSELAGLLAGCIADRMPVLISGSPGVGKSDIVAQSAAAAGADLVALHPAVMDPTDISGFPGLVDGKAHFFPFGQMLKLIEAGRFTVAHLEDLGQAPLSVQSALMQLILLRECGGHRISDFVTFIGSTNRRQDKAGVTGLIEPIKDRFSTIVELRADADDWRAWALGHGVAPVVVAFLRFRPELLSAFEASSGLSRSPTPRAWAFLSRHYLAGRKSLAVLAGAVGQAAAAEFLAFEGIWQSLPSIDGIFMSPATAAVPGLDKPSALYAVSGAVASRINAGNIGRAFVYIARLPREFQAYSVRDAIKRDGALCNTTEFISWASTNQDIL